MSRSDGAWFGPYRAAQRSAMQCSAVRCSAVRCDGPAGDGTNTSMIVMEIRQVTNEALLKASHPARALMATKASFVRHIAARPPPGHTNTHARAHTHTHTNPFMYTPHSPLRPQPLPNVGPRAPIPSPPIRAVQTGALRVPACAPIGLFVRRVRQAGPDAARSACLPLTGACTDRGRRVGRHAIRDHTVAAV